ncbi:type 1 glutamine amidotransferase domain-containing protein [Streptomyces sp. NBC_01571]|uniref:type 1 glutamine amidotransferase domain-containing protein n=1 Tax=Streptomyces sp. NBC_01571 TaxID=2975883 RepID=UPI002257AE50|nr:type 1 glutamine amidotransferase domain-containing protein [Streptomyces sp. NBC_01571]MCX4579735.1 type 1 glutamine amidotransferase domain-containing protein [Streptomyces sp. NBC_01571]
MPVPDRDADVTEVAVPWRILTDAGHEVVLATERAASRPAADPRLLTGVLLGQLGAAEEPRRYYQQLTEAAEFTATVSWEDVAVDDFDGLLLPGGHAPGMRQYLGSAALQRQVVSGPWGGPSERSATVSSCSPGASAVTTGPIPPTSRTRSRRPSATRVRSSPAALAASPAAAPPPTTPTRSSSRTVPTSRPLAGRRLPLRPPLPRPPGRHHRTLRAAA